MFVLTEPVAVILPVSAEAPAAPGLMSRKVVAGIADVSKGPAMTPLPVQAAVEVGTVKQ